MANRYSQIFTLKDIFNNEKLKYKLPLVNYSEMERDGGNVSVRTKMKTVRTQVFDTAIETATPYYKPLKASRNGNSLIIGGNLLADINTVVDSVYTALKGKYTLLLWTANNGDMIRSALKESEKNRRKYGNETKLYLRAKSMQQIEGMTRPQIQALLANIMENIFFGDDFPETQKSYNVTQLKYGKSTYSQMLADWKRRTGQ